MDLWELMYGCLEIEKAALRISDSFVVKLDFPASGKEVPASCSVPGVCDMNSWYFVCSSAVSERHHSSLLLILPVFPPPLCGGTAVCLLSYIGGMNRTGE